MSMTFALNHMVAPQRSVVELFDLAQALGLSQVEIRNDLQGTALLDGTPPADIGAAARRRGLTILSINALQRFNEWSEARREQAQHLIDDARACGARALVLCPVNDIGFMPGEKARLAGLRESLARLAELLRPAGIIGLVEPLGFLECSLRLKREAVEAIAEVGASDVFKLVHDTFHHHVAGETEFFPEQTGLVHISGVTDPSTSAATMRDPHRVLVDAGDRIDNVGQMRALLARGYAGPFSFEPFAEDVAALPDPQGAIAASMAFITKHVRTETA